MALSVPEMRERRLERLLSYGRFAVVGGEKNLPVIEGSVKAEKIADDVESETASKDKIAEKSAEAAKLAKTVKAVETKTAAKKSAVKKTKAVQKKPSQKTKAMQVADVSERVPEDAAAEKDKAQ